MRRAVDLAIDRDGYIKGVLQGAAVQGAALVPKPFGSWGLWRGRPRRRSSASRRGARRRRGSCSPRRATVPRNPLRFETQTRAIASYVDLASYVVNELKQVGVEITVKPLDSVQWYGITTRKEFQLGINISGFGVDDPDAILFENYACTSRRNYTGYCDEGVGKLMDQQSQELDPKKRLALVHADPEEAHGGGGAADRGLGHRPLRAVAAREEPRAPPLALQLRAHAGGVAGPLGPDAASPRNPPTGGPS